MNEEDDDAEHIELEDILDANPPLHPPEMNGRAIVYHNEPEAPLDVVVPDTEQTEPLEGIDIYTCAIFSILGTCVAVVATAVIGLIILGIIAVKDWINRLLER